MQTQIKYTLLFLLSMSCLCLGAYAQEQGQTPAQQKVGATIESLAQILDSIDQTATERKNLQKELESVNGRGREKEIGQEITMLSERLQTFEDNFREISSGIDAQDLEDITEDQKQDWSTEIRELLSPLIDEMKRVTSRPRELSELRTSISDNSSKFSLVSKGIDNIEEIISQTKDKELLKKLNQVKSDWLQRKQRVATELSIAKQKLKQREAEAKPILESVGSLFDIFFRSRGRNLILAFFITFVFWYSLRRAYLGLQDQEWIRKRGANRKARLVNVLYLFFSGAGSLIIFLFVLFFFGDWLLLVVAGMLLVGVLWSSRQMVPAFWARASLLLDMGTVREGERILIQGVPWKVGKINFFTLLSNPNLDGGFIRLPLQDLQDLRSRPATDDTVWFPTSTGDWVVLADGTFARVVSQGAEWVRLVELGNSYKTYTTADFVAQSPRALTQGFRVSVHFGIDYQHQTIVTKEVPDTLKAFLKEAFESEGISSEDVKVQVEFAEAGASSLNLAVICDFSGTMASKYQKLHRSIQRFCVDACNRHGWNIPFEQLTVHMAGNED